jgi:hypothetical protein
MNNITGDTPGFTAEASLYKTNKLYRMAATLEPMQGSHTVRPQRATGPFGPIGLPGQDCEGACWHMCMTFGGGLNCRDACRSTCTDLPSLYRTF